MNNEPNVTYTIKQIKQIVRDKNTGKPTLKCLSNNGFLENNDVNITDCPTDNNDPYYLFVIITENNTITAMSPFVGKCIGVGKDGKLVYNIGCGDDSSLMYLDRMLLNKNSECSGNASCGQYVFEEMNDKRIWWNTNAIDKTLSLNDNKTLGVKNLAYFNEKINTSSLPNITYSSNKGWNFVYTEQELNNYKNYVLSKYTVPNKENTLVAWGGYRTKKPIVAIIFGSSGIGKSYIIKNTSTKLNNPIWISYDIPIEHLNEFKALSHLEEIGFPIKSSDPKAYKTFYKFASNVEEALKKEAIKSKIDLIIEKADVPKLTQITSYIEEGYDVKLIYVIGGANESIRKNRMVKRFTQTGRLGKYNETIDEDDVNKLYEQLKNIHNVEFETIHI